MYSIYITKQNISIRLCDISYLTLRTAHTAPPRGKADNDNEDEDETFLRDIRHGAPVLPLSSKDTSS